jgi:hypothetical protein
MCCETGTPGRRKPKPPATPAQPREFAEPATPSEGVDLLVAAAGLEPATYGL